MLINYSKLDCPYIYRGVMLSLCSVADVWSNFLFIANLFFLISLLELYVENQRHN